MTGGNGRARGTGAESDRAESDRAHSGDEAAEPLPNLAVRVWELLMAPGRLFDRLRERPASIGVVVLMVIVALASTWFMPEELLRQAATASMPADATAEQMESAARFARIGGYVGSVVGPPIAVLLVAGMLLFCFNVVLGGAAEYRQLVSVSGHALLVPTLGSLLVLPLMITANDPGIALALHLLVPGLEEGFMFRLLHGLNVFGIWAAVLLGLAVSRLYPRQSLGPSVTVVLGIYVGLKVAWALIGGLFGA